MGFDVTWHPISQAEMRQWYFDRLPEARKGDFSSALGLALRHRMGQASGDQLTCRKAYRQMLEQGAQLSPDAPFDKSHSYLLAMVQGLFRPYYYTRDGIYSGLAEMFPRMAGYTLPFREILGEGFPGAENARNRVYENYCGGVYIPEDQVPRLLADYESGSVEGLLKQCFGGSLTVFLYALLHAKEEGLGLLEAAGVVEPDPMDLQKTTCRSYLTNCDLKGVEIYAETARRQTENAARDQDGALGKSFAQHLRQAEASPERAEPPAASPAPRPNAPAKKKGFFGRLFGGK